MKSKIIIKKIRQNACSDEFVTVEAIEIDQKTLQENIVVQVDGENVNADIFVREDRFIWDKYDVPGHNPVAEVFINVSKKDFENKNVFGIFRVNNDNLEKCDACNVKKLLEASTECLKKVDSVSKNKDTGLITLRGWGASIEDVVIDVCDVNGNKINADVKYVYRSDVESQFPELKNQSEYIEDSVNSDEVKLGFLVDFEKGSNKEVELHIHRSGNDERIKVDLDKALAFDPSSRWHRAKRYYENNGFKAFVNHGLKKVIETTKGSVDERYASWMKLNDVTKEELERQRSVSFNENVTFSILVPTYNTPIKYLSELVESVQGQTYSKWELCIADGSDNDKVEKFLKALDDERIVYKHLSKNEGIAENTNKALEMATGEYIVLGDHDDVFSLDALYELMVQISENNAKVIYSDEDKIDTNGKERFDPYFKSDFNIDLLCSNNYICHLFCVTRELALKVGGFDSRFDGAQDHDFILKCVSEVDKVYHIPKILYHWRCHRNSTAQNPESKLYAFEAGKNAVKKYFDSKSIPIEMEDGVQYGQYHARHIVQGKPLVSIIIPNKDHIDDLDKCLKSINRNIYDNYEVIVVENNSEEASTEEYYSRISNVCPKARVIRWEDEFNYSRINNYGVKEAKGEYILFLNNDIEAINDDWLDRMLGYCQREDVGIVGAQLLYPDGMIQHAGVVVGFGNIAGHAFVGLYPEQCKAFGRAMLTQDYSAVTAACLLTKKTIFEEVGGFDEEFKVAFNDIDYCMKVRSKDKKVVYNSFAVLTHYESKSRGAEDTPEKKQRFADEIRMFQEKWADILRDGDPYYNVNLALDRADFAIKP